MPKLALSVAEAAAALSISRSKLYELIAAGDIPTVKCGGRRLVPATSLENYLQPGGPQ